MVTKKKTKKPRRVYIFDTTLRDGEQSPGASMTPEEKIKVAEQLERLNVDIIEAGFPAASPGEIEAIQMISKKVKKPVIAGLARMRKGDIDAACEALKFAKKKKIHVFLATSPIHRKYKLKMEKAEILDTVTKMITYAANYFDDIEYSPEDATRTERDFLAEVVKTAIAAGATAINIPDTVGYTLPEEFGTLIAYLVEKNPSLGKKVVLSVHCHNDLGLASANSLSAILNGANQVECTVNGIGERAGNASLEEVVMTLKTRQQVYHADTMINVGEIMKSSKIVSNMTGITVQPNKAVVGRNAFSHEAGIHQDGILKKRQTYEIMDPKDIGLTETRLVMGKHSGRHAFKTQLVRLGFDLNDQQVEKAFAAFKVLADRKKNIYDEDIEAIVQDQIAQSLSAWHLEYLKVNVETDKPPMAVIRIKKDSEERTSQSSGDGPVDACYKAIEKVTGVKAKLVDYSIHSVTSGKDALGEVSVKVAHGANEYSGRGASTDVIEASVKAYLVAINKILVKK
ncbi:MAG: 2-isopropylmalate synthase [Candidatus Omnitrophica bacterium]|nr:2-isopropylmalate synthase [Candidatus Omnitrophota bacterium]